MHRLIALCLLCLTLAVPLYAQDNPLTPYEIALQRIEAARESGATELDLSGLGLTELPPEISQLSNLQILYLSDNKLTNLPPEVGQLSQLQVLFLSINELTSLPLEIVRLSNLQGLFLDANQFTVLPPEVLQLRNLRGLSLNFNRLASLPPEIAQLNNLQLLALRDNQLTSLPPEIEQLYHICQLDLNDNNLNYLPTTLGNLSGLGQSQTCWFIPSGLDLGANPLISPPPEVVEQGTAAVLAYLRNQAWYHTQRLIIGAAGGVGLFVLLLLGFRWKQRGGRKPKQKRG